MSSAQLPPVARRILIQLERLEAREPNPHYQSDYRIAWIACRLAARGEPTPHAEATRRVLGLHPDKVWPAIVERRKALLGHYYTDFWGVSLPPVLSPGLPPKKPAQSVRVGAEARKTIGARAINPCADTTSNGCSSGSIPQFGGRNKRKYAHRLDQTAALGTAAESAA